MLKNYIREWDLNLGNQQSEIVRMEGSNSSDSDCELVIDETIIVSSDDDECVKVNNGIQSVNEKLIEVAAVAAAAAAAAAAVGVDSEDEDHWSTKGLYKNLFHPQSISSADMKDELFNEETYTCTICNETFKYNVGLICHLEMEHKEEIKESKKRKNKIRTKKVTKKLKKLVTLDSNVNKLNTFAEKEEFKKVCVNAMNDENGKITATTVLKKSCELCKKSFTDPNKLSKHEENCLKVGLKFHCIYCKSKFGWESKYKKHLFKTHKLNAAVICKLCSDVFSDVASLAKHSGQCNDTNKRVLKKSATSTVPTATTVNTNPNSTVSTVITEISV